MKSKKKGFTLIELLVVIAIIAILAAILFPVFSRAREQARKAACLSNGKQIGTALMMYVQDWDETYPFWVLPCSPAGFQQNGGLFPTEQLQPYMKNWDVWRCPSAAPTQGYAWSMCYPGVWGRPQNNQICTYGFNAALVTSWSCSKQAVKLSQLKGPSEDPIIADCNIVLWHSYATCGFENGSTVGVARGVAFSNYPDCWHGGGCINNAGYNLCDPAQLQQAIDKYSRHTGGSVLIFADGHAKWYPVMKIKDKAGGGPINLCPPRY
jgi:prepilin-type N-terminal cleavage/methylation domain-containing protein/prepilin-type processing-associated H-X9-DG protein